MKKVSLFIVGLFIMGSVLSAPPTRTHTYTSGSKIIASEVTTNEDNIYSYLQAGVDTIANNAVTTGIISDGTIENADISATAGIVGSKLDLSEPGIIGGTTPAAGTFTNLTGTEIIGTGTATFNDSSNAVVVRIDNDGTNHGLHISQDAINASSDYALYVETGVALDNSPLVFFDSNDLTTGTNDQPVVKIQQNYDGSTGYVVLYVQDGTGVCAYYDVNNGSNTNAAAEISHTGNGPHITMSGTTSNTGSAEGDFWYDSDNKLYYRDNSAEREITYVGASDERAKTNVKDTEVGLDNLLDIRVVDFNYKVGYGDPDKDQIGIIAQELEPLYPFAVGSRANSERKIIGEVDEVNAKADGKIKDGYVKRKDKYYQVSEEVDFDTLYTVDYSKLVPLLVKSIQELNAKVEVLEKR